MSAHHAMRCYTPRMTSTARLSRLALLGCVLGSAASCATLVGRQAPPEQPTLRIKADPKDAKGPRCVAFGEVERKRGSVPSSVDVLAKIEVSADRPVSLRLIEDALAEWSVNHCADGYHVLSAAAAEGAEGIVEVSAVGWSRRPESADVEADAPTAPPSPASTKASEAEFWE